MHPRSTVSLVDHLHWLSTLPTHDLCAFSLQTPQLRPWLVTPEIRYVDTCILGIAGRSNTRRMPGMRTASVI